MKPCSMCGNKPAVCVDRMHKGTYWLCGDCAGERIEELIHLRARIKALEKLLTIAKLYMPTPQEHMKGAVEDELREWWADVAALAAEPKLIDLGGGLSSYENLGRNPPEKRAALDAEEET